jgi:hypothetical protein
LWFENCEGGAARSEGTGARFESISACYVANCCRQLQKSSGIARSSRLVFVYYARRYFIVYPSTQVRRNEARRGTDKDASMPQRCKGGGGAAVGCGRMGSPVASCRSRGSRGEARTAPPPLLSPDSSPLHSRQRLRLKMPPPTTWSTPLFDAQTPQGGEDGDFDDGGLGSGAADFSEPDDGLPEGGCNCRSRDIVSETQPDDSDSLSFGFQC